MYGQTHSSSSANLKIAGRDLSMTHNSEPLSAVGLLFMLFAHSVHARTQAACMWTYWICTAGFYWLTQTSAAVQACKHRSVNRKLSRKPLVYSAWDLTNLHGMSMLET